MRVSVSLTCLGHFDQFFIAELAQVLLHLWDGLGDGAKWEIWIHSDAGQLLCIRLGY